MEKYEKPDLTVLNDTVGNEPAPLALFFVVGPIIIAAAAVFLVVGAVYSAGAAVQLGTAIQGIHVVQTQVEIYS